MNILFDTDVLISSLISDGICKNIFDHCIKNHKLFASKYIEDEFVRKLTGKFKYSLKEVQESKKIVFDRIEIVKIENISIKKLSDKKDEPIISTALSGKCEIIVTGDKKVLKLKKYKNIEIISPSDFLRYEYKKKK